MQYYRLLVIPVEAVVYFKAERFFVQPGVLPGKTAERYCDPTGEMFPKRNQNRAFRRVELSCAVRDIRGEFPVRRVVPAVLIVQPAACYIGDESRGGAFPGAGSPPDNKKSAIFQNNLPFTKIPRIMRGRAL